MSKIAVIKIKVTAIIITIIITIRVTVILIITLIFDNKPNITTLYIHALRYLFSFLLKKKKNKKRKIKRKRKNITRKYI